MCAHVFLYVLHENMFNVDNADSFFFSQEKEQDRRSFCFSTALLPLIALIEPQCGLIASTVEPNLFIYLFLRCTY